METHTIPRRFQCGHCDYSSNTASYLKIHYNSKHPGIPYNNVEAQASIKPLPPNTKAYRWAPFRFSEYDCVWSDGWAAVRFAGACRATTSSATWWT